jgi:glycosyltransferase 2 family protein
MARSPHNPHFTHEPRINMKKHAKAWAIGIGKYGIGIGLLAYVIGSNWKAKGGNPGIQGLLQQTPDLPLFGLLAVIAVAATSIQFLRWYLLVRALDLPFSIGSAFRLGLIGVCYNVFLPGSVGGDLVKAYYIARDTPGKRASAVATVVADRLVGLFGLLWFSAVFGGGFWLAGDPRIVGNPWLEKIILVCSVLVGLTVLFWIGLGFLPSRRQERFAGRLIHIPKVGHTLAEIWFVLCTYRQRSKTIYLTIAMTAVVHIGFVFMFHLAVRVFATIGPASLPEHFVVAPIGYIAQAFFPAPGGVGGGEFIFGYLYSLLGRPETTGVIGRLTIRVVEWSIGLVGLYLWLRMRRELPEVEHAAGAEGYGGHEERELIPRT